MSLVRLWLFLVTLIAGIAAAVAMLAPREVADDLDTEMNTRLERTHHAASLLLRVNARKWIDTSAQVASDAVLVESLDQATRGPADLTLVHKTVQDRLKYFNERMKVDLVIATDARGRVIARVGLVALFAGALAVTPLLASGVVGVTVVFGRRMKRGDEVEVGGRRGRVLDVTLLDVRIEDDALAEVSVPHILALVHPTRVHRHAQLATLEVVVDPSHPQDEVERVLFEAARAQSSRGRVELVYLDQAGAHWRVTSAAVRHERTLAKVVQDALATLGIGLGRGRSSPPRSVRTPSASARPEET